jgi:hypothetical protein
MIINVKPNEATIATIPNAPGIRYKIDIRIPMPRIIKASEITIPKIGLMPKTLGVSCCSTVEILFTIVLNKPVVSSLDVDADIFVVTWYGSLIILIGNLKAKLCMLLRILLAS